MSTKYSNFLEGLPERLKSEVGKFQSPEEAAERLAMGKSTLYNWLKGIGSPKLGDLEKMASAGMDVHFILFGAAGRASEPGAEYETSPSQQNKELAENWTKLTAARRALVTDLVRELAAGLDDQAAPNRGSGYSIIEDQDTTRAVKPGAALRK